MTNSLTRDEPTSSRVSLDVRRWRRRRWRPLPTDPTSRSWDWSCRDGTGPTRVAERTPAIGVSRQLEHVSPPDLGLATGALRPSGGACRGQWGQHDPLEIVGDRLLPASLSLWLTIEPQLEAAGLHSTVAAPRRCPPANRPRGGWRRYPTTPGTRSRTRTSRPLRNRSR